MLRGGPELLHNHISKGVWSLGAYIVLSLLDELLLCEFGLEVAGLPLLLPGVAHAFPCQPHGVRLSIVRPAVLPDLQMYHRRSS